MLAPHLENKVKKLWDNFWTAGISNPLVAIEQITYLLFLKQLERLDQKRQYSLYTTQPITFQPAVGEPEAIHHPKADQCTWSYIYAERESVEHLNTVVFPWLRDLEKIIVSLDSDSSTDGETVSIGNRMSDAYFQLDPNKGAILGKSIVLIEQLFKHIDVNTDNDLMGDIFEYLLSEVSSSGKNGQFRTPRHIIRVLVELLDPKPGERIIDPAAGTGGFLFSAMSHIMKEHTPEDMLKLEWDGTPHRATGADLTPEQDKVVHEGNYYVGLDNDRTMVRIGWMNMILHGIINPQIHQRDSLGKIKDDDVLKGTLASESFQYVLANPPFTGTVDKGSLDLEIFPKAGTTPKKAKLALTDKSELLFLWRMLDLLEVGGRCAVIIPEGVMFGSTEAHVRLRRELLTEHTVEAVISLPGGAFQPYTGVKTSVVVFQKDTPKAEKAADGIWFSGKIPRTERVWFYEVEEEAFEPTAKRGERKRLDNDLWDMLEKFKSRLDGVDEGLDYYKPDYEEQRWRLVDDRALKVFPDNRAVSGEKGKVAAIHELFSDLPQDPQQALEQVEQYVRPKVREVIEGSMGAYINQHASVDSNWSELVAASQTVFKSMFKSLARNQETSEFFEKDGHGRDLFRKVCEQELTTVVAAVMKSNAEDAGSVVLFPPDDVELELKEIACECAKLDGFNVMLRTIRAVKDKKYLERNKKESKSWWAEVRVYARDDEWCNEDGKLKGSHDDSGIVRPEYLNSIDLYDSKTGKLNEWYLDPDCIEARGWNLSAGQYKPFDFSFIESDQSVAEMLTDLEEQEKKILAGLTKLKSVIETDQ